MRRPSLHKIEKADAEIFPISGRNRPKAVI